MDADLLVVGALTYVIHPIGTLAYGVRIAGRNGPRAADRAGRSGIAAIVE